MAPRLTPSGRQIRFAPAPSPAMTAPRLRQALGLMRLNLRRHSEARHNGLYLAGCRTCDTHRYHIDLDERALDGILSPTD